MASQRHKLLEQGSTAAGEIHAEGVVAPGIAMQVDPSTPNVMMPGPAAPPYVAGKAPGEDDGEGKHPDPKSGVEVPEGPPGGPLAGSSLTGAIPESIAPPEIPGPEPGPEPEPGMEPTLEYIAPAEAVIGSTDFTLRVIGTNFTDTSVIVFNGGDEPTTFVSDTELETGIKPSTASVAGSYPVIVKQGTYFTPPQQFTFTDAAPGTEGARSYPVGPINIAIVEDHPDGLQLTLTEAADVQVEDTVLIEATGNTGVNGSYEVLESDGTVLVVDNDLALAAPIEAKGRLTVTA